MTAGDLRFHFRSDYLLFNFLMDVRFRHEARGFLRSTRAGEARKERKVGWLDVAWQVSQAWWTSSDRRKAWWVH